MSKKFDKLWSLELQNSVGLKAHVRAIAAARRLHSEACKAAADHPALAAAAMLAKEEAKFQVSNAIAHLRAHQRKLRRELGVRPAGDTLTVREARVLLGI